MKLHPFCEIFPPMPDDQYRELVEDIRIRGLVTPIIVHEGQILDGRHRWKACQELGVEPKVEEFTGGDAHSYVVSVNLKRRHLDESQRAMLGARLANYKFGDNQHTTSHLQTLSAADAAEIVNVGMRSVSSAKKVLQSGVEELAEAVDAGQVAVSIAAKIAGMDHDEQRVILAADKPEVAVKKILREKKERSLAHKTIEKAIGANTKLYNVIYADPPWRFQNFSEAGMDRSASNHYPTMIWEDIAVLEVPSADDAVCFMWATVPMLPEALAVLRRWGFEYKSQVVWVKERPGTGYWVRNWHEILLIGTKGQVPAPAPGTQPPSVVQAPAGGHSEKPTIFAETIEKLFPNVPKLELFSRQPRYGWDVMGNEVEE